MKREEYISGGAVRLELEKRKQSTVKIRWGGK